MSFLRKFILFARVALGDASETSRLRAQQTPPPLLPAAARLSTSPGASPPAMADATCSSGSPTSAARSWARLFSPRASVSRTRRSRHAIFTAGLGDRRRDPRHRPVVSGNAIRSGRKPNSATASASARSRPNTAASRPGSRGTASMGSAPRSKRARAAVRCARSSRCGRALARAPPPGSPGCARSNRPIAPSRRMPRSIRRISLLKVNPLLDWTRERVLDFVRQHDIPYNRAARSRLPLDRLRALHARGRAGRARARRPLVVGTGRKEGMRAA